MTDAEKEFIIEVLKALAGIKRKLEKFIDSPKSVEKLVNGGYVVLCKDCYKKIIGKEIKQTYEVIKKYLCPNCIDKNDIRFINYIVT